MIRRFQNLKETGALDYRTDDFEDIVVSAIGGVIVLAFVFVIIPAIVSILLR